MIEIAELVESLRTTADDHHGRCGRHGLAGQCREASDALEAMARENERLMSDNRDLVQHCVSRREAAQMWQARALSSESRLDALAMVDSKQP